MMRLIETQSKSTLAAWAISYARENYLTIYEEECPGDLRLREGISACEDYLCGGRRLAEVKPVLKEAAEIARNLADQPVAQAAARNLEAKYPGLNICGVHDGYFQDDGPVVEDIRSAAADAVFVCLGAPKQEFWMVKNGPATGAKLLAGLGGSLDVFAGVTERAPEAWQKLGLEWLYRLTREPRRIGRMAKLPLFLVSALVARGKSK